MELTLLRDITLIFGLAIVVIIVSRRVGIPAIVALLLTGIVGGPHGLGLIRAVDEVDVMAEIGVVLLLFTIGMEFSLPSLMKSGRAVLLGGALQFVLAAAAVTAAAAFAGMSARHALFVGILAAPSSTALVLKTFQERAEVDTPYGRFSLGILIFQDLAVVPLVLLLPVLAGASPGSGAQVAVHLAKGAGVAALAVALARFLVPRILLHAARSRDRELFLLAVLFIGFSVAWVTAAAGLSLALGAFLAGLIISESEFSHKALGDILPLRDIFTSLFFVSVGMLLNLGTFRDLPWIVLGVAAAVLIVKTGAAAAAALALGKTARIALLTGLALFQVGEFSFILAREGVKVGLMDGRAYNVFLGVAVLTMMATPFLIAAGPRAADAVAAIPLVGRLAFGRESAEPDAEEKRLHNHVIIVGFGPSGRNLAMAARSTGIPYTALELNPDTVRREQAAGEPVVFGDAAAPTSLERCGIRGARILVVAIPDRAATRRVVELARRLNPGIHIIARSPFINEMEPLYRLGANEVIPEEFETSVEIFTRVLNRYFVPHDEIEQCATRIRSDRYRMWRSSSRDRQAATEITSLMPDLEIRTFRVGPSSEAVGRSLSELALRKRFEVTLLAIRRGGEVISNPGGGERLLASDIVLLLGKTEALSRAASFLQAHGVAP